MVYINPIDEKRQPSVMLYMDANYEASWLGSHEDARYKSPHVQIPHMYSITDTRSGKQSQQKTVMCFSEPISLT